MKQISFEDQLKNHLWKSELDFRAKHQTEPCCIEWLVPHCNSLSQIYRFLKDLGYRNMEMCREKDPDREYQWVQTKHFSVHVNTQASQGFFFPRS